MATNAAAPAYRCRQCLSTGVINDSNSKGNMVMHLGGVHAMGPFRCSVCPDIKRARKEGVESHIRAAVRSRNPLDHGAAQVVRVQALQDAIAQEADECKWPHSGPWVAPGPGVAANTAPTTAPPAPTTAAPVAPPVAPHAALSVAPPSAPPTALPVASDTSTASPPALPASNGRETRSSLKRKQAEVVDEDDEDDDQEEEMQQVTSRTGPSTRGLAVVVSKSRRAPAARRAGRVPATKTITKEETAEEEAQKDKKALESLLFG